MSVNVNEVIRKLNPAACKKVEDRAAEMIADEINWRDLRKARKLTQARVAKTPASIREAFRGSKEKRPVNLDVAKDCQSHGRRLTHCR